MKLVEKTGACRFCGQTKLIKVLDTDTDEYLDEQAILGCNCNDAKMYKRAKEIKEEIEREKISARGTTHTLFHEKYPELETILNCAIDPLTAGKAKKVTITTDDKVKASITWKNGTLEVTREDKNIQTIRTKVQDINNVY